MLNLYWKLRSLTTRQEGQGMVEYALILVLVGALSSLHRIGGKISVRVITMSPLLRIPSEVT